METLGLQNGDAFADSDDENLPLHVSEEDKDSNMNKKLSKKLSALGIAKLPGFFEWLSIHPIMSKVDEEEGREESCGSHKMIIFCYHHKVLDGVQVRLCEKEIQFVRIDCNVVGSDRQAAIQSFQFSKEVKIALIGIRSGGSGLNLTAADTVVFLELPLRPADMQQAEDRAHRHGQKKLVNIYIFCAKDTVDESHWQRLNRSLLRVSSTVNGKCGALQEIEVESVSYLETTGRISEESKNLLDDEPATKLMKVQGSSFDLDSKVNYGEQNEPNVISSWTNELHFENATLRNDEYGARAEFESVSCSQSMKGSADGVSQKINGGMSTHSASNNDEKKIDFESRASFSDQEALRFEVSSYTGRIHLYSCLPGTDLRPKPLFINIRPEEFDAENVKEIQPYKDALMDFIAQWKKLRPIEKRKLIGKPLQLPLSYELCYLNESLNHDSKGIINGGSKRRKTPKEEISSPLPPNATWKKVNLYGGRGEKEKLYTQSWSDINEPLCKLCQKPCKHHNAKVPQFFEDLFCGLDCFEEYRSRTSNRFLREELFKIEKGVCTNCGLDCHKLVEHLRPLLPEQRQAYIKKKASNVAERKKLLEKLVNDPTEGNAWHADHIVPVYRGGGECRLDNIRTLCVACHADVTNVQCAERRIARKKAKKQLKDIMNGFKTVNKSGKPDNAQDKKEENDVDDLLIDIPGSAYSKANCSSETTKDGERNEQEQQLLHNPPCTNNARSEDLILIQNDKRLKELENNPTCNGDPTRSVACTNNSNEASQVISNKGKELKSVETAHCESVVEELNEIETRNVGNPSRKSLFSELKTLLGNDF